MQEIIDLERRITAALERIARSVAQSAAPRAAPSDPAEIVAPENLQDALEEERMANAQLHERLRILRDRESVDRQNFEAEVAALKATHAGEARDLVTLVETMTRELTALRAERRAEAEEITDIVAALNPLIVEARHA